MQNKRIEIRISDLQKIKWKKICKEENIDLTTLIFNSVEFCYPSLKDKRISRREISEILKFIESQDNYFLKVQTNINQYAKIANGQKHISELMMSEFLDLLRKVIVLKEKQNEMFDNFFNLLSKYDI